MGNFTYAHPMIPGGLLHDMYEIESGSGFSQENGGQWIPGEDKKVLFKGVVLPVNDKDLIRDTGGTFTQYSEKIYTNGHSLQIGARVEDSNGAEYTVTQELGHNTLHPMKRYLVERKGAAAKR